ncbi:hypothetical protein [Burkholderia seminalis]|nr:hypothetical protein [Burkholderia seminalis]MDN7592161.1 hypothetical protein [Burkholderia seminalis]
MRDVMVELKALRLHGMASAWCDLQEQGPLHHCESVVQRSRTYDVV